MGGDELLVVLGPEEGTDLGAGIDTRMGGWVGGRKVEEEEGVGMSYCGLTVGGWKRSWVGGWVGGRGKVPVEERTGVGVPKLDRSI